MDDTEVRLQSFIDKFDPDNQEIIRDTRGVLKKRLPDCAELDDPDHILQGVGKVNPFVRVPSPDVLSAWRSIE